MKSRRERREEARKNKTTFEPQYKTGTRLIRNDKGEAETVITGGAPKSHEEAYGVGYERFNNKFVTIKEVVAEEEAVEVSEEATEETK